MDRSPTRRIPSQVAARRRRRARVLLWRWRHVVAAIAVACAAAVAVTGARPVPAPTRAAAVVVRNMEAGARLGAGDVAVRRVPATLVPEGVIGDSRQVVGATLAVGLPAGFPVTARFLVGPGLTAAAPPGTVVVPVRLADADVTRLLHPGDRVDLLRSPAEGGPAQVVARDVLVMARAETRDESGLGLGPEAAPLLLVAAAPEVATLLVGAGAWDPISAVLVPGDR